MLKDRKYFVTTGVYVKISFLMLQNRQQNLELESELTYYLYQAYFIFSLFSG